MLLQFDIMLYILYTSIVYTNMTYQSIVFYRVFVFCIQYNILYPDNTTLSLI